MDSDKIPELRVAGSSFYSPCSGKNLSYLGIDPLVSGVIGRPAISIKRNYDGPIEVNFRYGNFSNGGNLSVESVAGIVEEQEAVRKYSVGFMENRRKDPLAIFRILFSALKK